jgi:hypothetical protein
MAGGWQTYRCDRWPLVLELGGLTGWDRQAGVVYRAVVQVACGGYGTTHRITEERGACLTAAAFARRFPVLEEHFQALQQAHASAPRKAHGSASPKRSGSRSGQRRSGCEASSWWP